MKFSHIALTTGLLTLSMAGCVDTEHETADNPREYWQPVAGAQPSAPLDMPVALPGTSNLTSSGQSEMNLPALVDIALNNNPQTRQAWYAAKSAAANLGEVNSQYYPQVFLDGNLTRDKTRTVGLNGQSFGAQTTYSTYYGPSLQINYLLWNFGKNYAETEAARQNLYSANYAYNQQIQDVILATQLAYFNYNAAQGFVDAAQATLNDASTTYKAANARLEAKLGTTQDERQAFAQVKNAEYQLEQAQALVETARAQLALSLGIPVTNGLNIIRNEKLTGDVAQLDQDVSALMAAAMRLRPDLMAAYANVQAAEYNVKAAKDDQWPVISAVSSLNYGYLYGGTTHGNPSNNYSAGLQVSWDIFNGFNKTYAIISAQDQAKAAREILRANELKIISDVWNFYYSYKSAIHQVESTAAQVDAQQVAYNAINAGYGAGLNSYVDLQTALSNLATARQQKVQADATLGTAIANLTHATGNMPLAPVVPQK